MDDLTRRSFLKVAGLAVAGTVGAGALSRVQAQEQEKKPKEKEEEEPKEEEPNYDDLFAEDEGDDDTRACPQCGALMYRQGRNWSCENCGYSYVE